MLEYEAGVIAGYQISEMNSVSGIFHGRVSAIARFRNGKLYIITEYLWLMAKYTLSDLAV